MQPSDIADGATFAPLALLVAGLFIFGKLWPSRSGITATAWLAVFHYLYWRLTCTIPWEEGASRLWWPLLCLGVEMTALFDAAILYLILFRPTDRSREADANEARLRAVSPSALSAVDVFIATYNEPREVVEKTILGCLALDWPDARVWVLDDGRRVWLRDLCAEKGAGYITRPNNQGAKAGNINHAIAVTDAPFVAVFDADFIPRRDFLMRTMGFFRESRIGIVQVPHSFYNHDPFQTNLSLQQAMPDDQRFFFEALMPGRDGWDAAFCCGSNSVTRRALFQEIGGGLPEGSVTEDMLLTLSGLREGYVTRYLNEPLAHGLAPESMAAFFVQRQRWAQGAMQILHLPQGPLGPGLSPRHRLLFLPSAWITQGLQSLLAFVTPIVFLLFGLAPLVNVDLMSVCHYLLPMVVGLVGGITLLAPGRYYPLAAQLIGAFQSFRILPTALQTLIRPKGLVFRVTPKGAAAEGAGWEQSIWFAAVGLIGLTLAGLAINLVPEYRMIPEGGSFPVVALWSTLNMVLLMLVAMLCLQKTQMRSEERFALREPLTILSENGAMVTSTNGDISISGVGVIHDGTTQFGLGERVNVVLPSVGMIRGIIRRTGTRIGVAFDFQSEQIRDRLIVHLFTGRMEVNTLRPGALAAAVAIIRRLWLADMRTADSVHGHSAIAEEKLSAETRVIAGGQTERARENLVPRLPAASEGVGEDVQRLRA
jgi:cellulose synthase (UDP-forming)